MNVKGRCHCGNLTFDLQWNSNRAEIPARTCGCGFCTRHGATWTSDPAAQLQVLARDGARVNVYRFGTRTADFHVCTICGNAAFVSCEIDGRLYAVVNVNLFDEDARSRVHAATAQFEGEETCDRIERRRRTWIPDVRYRTA